MAEFSVARRVPGYAGRNATKRMLTCEPPFSPMTEKTGAPAGL